MMNTPMNDAEVFNFVHKMFKEDTNNEAYYIVFTMSKHSAPWVVYSGMNEEKAIEVANFWDERQNTYMVSNFEVADYFKNMSVTDKIEYNANKALERLNAMVDEMNAR